MTIVRTIAEIENLNVEVFPSLPTSATTWKTSALTATAIVVGLLAMGVGVCSSLAIIGIDVGGLNCLSSLSYGRHVFNGVGLLLAGGGFGSLAGIIREAINVSSQKRQARATFRSKVNSLIERDKPATATPLHNGVDFLTDQSSRLNHDVLMSSRLINESPRGVYGRLLVTKRYGEERCTLEFFATEERYHQRWLELQEQGFSIAGNQQPPKAIREEWNDRERAAQQAAS